MTPSPVLFGFGIHLGLFNDEDKLRDIAILAASGLLTWDTAGETLSLALYGKIAIPYIRIVVFGLVEETPVS